MTIDDRPVVVNVRQPFAHRPDVPALHIEYLPTTPGFSTGAEISQETAFRLIVALAEKLNEIARDETQEGFFDPSMVKLLKRRVGAEEFARWVVELDNPDPDSDGFQERRSVGLGDITKRARKALGLPEE